MPARNRDGSLEIVICEEPRTVLFADLLRDGRVALGTRTLERGEWKAGELHLLEPAAYLGLAAWLAPAVEDAWVETVRARAAESLRTAQELYGDGPASVRQLATDMTDELPASLLARAMMLLANAIGPEARERLVARLNATDSVSEDAWLRRRLADEREAFAYVVAAAALYDSIARGPGEDG